MSYGSANDDERLLTYASSKQSVANSPPAPTSSSSSSSSSSARVGGSTHVPIQPAHPNSMSTAAAPTPSPSSATNSMSGLPSALSSALSSGAATDRVTSYARQTWADCRPWTEFYSTAAISFPAFHALSDRVSTNVHFYRANYQVLAAFWLAFFVLSAIPAFVVAAASFFLLDRWAARAAARNGGKLPHKDMVVISLVALAVIWLTGIARHVLTSLFLSSVFIVAHAALHEPATIETEIAAV